MRELSFAVRPVPETVVEGEDQSEVVRGDAANTWPTLHCSTALPGLLILATIVACGISRAVRVSWIMLCSFPHPLHVPTSELAKVFDVIAVYTVTDDGDRAIAQPWQFFAIAEGCKECGRGAGRIPWPPQILVYLTDDVF